MPTPKRQRLSKSPDPFPLALDNSDDCSFSLLELPDELLLLVLRFVGYGDLGRVACVCRRLAAAAVDEWQHWASVFFALPVAELSKPDWQTWRDRCAVARRRLQRISKAPSTVPICAGIRGEALQAVTLGSSLFMLANNRIVEYQTAGVGDWVIRAEKCFAPRSARFAFLRAHGDVLLVASKKLDEFLVVDARLNVLLCCTTERPRERVIAFAGRLFSWQRELVNGSTWLDSAGTVATGLCMPARFASLRVDRFLAVSPDTLAFLATTEGSIAGDTFVENYFCGGSLCLHRLRSDPRWLPVEAVCSNLAVSDLLTAAVRAIAGHALVAVARSSDRRLDVFSPDFGARSTHLATHGGTISDESVVAANDLLYVGFYRVDGWFGSRGPSSLIRLCAFNLAAELLWSTMFEPRPGGQPLHFVRIWPLADGCVMVESQPISHRGRPGWGFRGAHLRVLCP